VTPEAQLAETKCAATQHEPLVRLHSARDTAAIAIDPCVLGKQTGLTPIPIAP